MENNECECAYEKVYAVQYAGLRDELLELKTRVGRLETTLAQGILLLVANLAGMVVTLVHQIF